MTVVHHNFSDISNRTGVHQVKHSAVASIPGCFVVHQHLDVRFACGAFDGLGVLQTDGERFFHHDRDVVLRAEFHNLSVIEGVGINKNRLRPGGTQHLFEIGVIQGGVKFELGRVAIEEAAVWIADSGDVYVGAMYRIREKPLNVTVNKAGDGDSQRLWFSRVQDRDGKKRRHQQKSQHEFHGRPPKIRVYYITGEFSPTVLEN